MPSTRKPSRLSFSTSSNRSSPDHVDQRIDLVVDLVVAAAGSRSPPPRPCRSARGRLRSRRPPTCGGAGSRRGVRPPAGSRARRPGRRARGRPGRSGCAGRSGSSCSGRRSCRTSSLARPVTSTWRSRTTWSCVSVPVLSVQRMSMAPKFWIDGSRLTMTFLLRHGQRALGQVDGDDHRQHFRGEADGDRQAEEQRLHPVALGQADDEEHRADHDHHEADHQPGEGRARPGRSWSPRAVRPAARRWRRRRSASPVLTTTPRAVPLVTLLPRKQAFGSSMAALAGGVARLARVFSTGMDSPVSADWLTKKSLAAISRRSAGMMEPACRSTISPGNDLARSGSRSPAPSLQDEGAGLHALAQRFDGPAGPAVQDVGQARR